MKFYRWFLLLLCLPLACSKPEEHHHHPTAEFIGEWQRGPYDFSQFWQPTQWETVHSSMTTQAFHFINRTDCEFYSVSFPINVLDCSKQRFLYLKGRYSINLSDSSFAFVPESGKVREFYKSCPATPDVSKNLEQAEVGGEQKYYWSFRKENGKEYMIIRFVQGATASTFLERKK